MILSYVSCDRAIGVRLVHSRDYRRQILLLARTVATVALSLSLSQQR